MIAIRNQFKGTLSQWKDCPSNYVCCNHSFIRYICQWIVIVFIHTMIAIRKQFKGTLSQWKDCPSKYICCNHSFIRYICQWIVIVFIHTKSIFLASVARLFSRAFISSVREESCKMQTNKSSKPKSKIHQNPKQT